ncbi:MAG: S-layer homology domain-containing protein [Anaerolineales bacterium]|nr:S-layer homology domain-containing protein [Anaerolineales bacterium]
MKKNIILLTLVLTLLAASFNVRPARAASAVVGSGTPASCTETAFNTALSAANSGGGTITFNCGAAVTTINFTAQKSIFANNVTINGNNLIILSGGNTTRLFYVNGGLTFHLQNITLSNGKSLQEGAAVYSIGSQVFLESVQFLNNNATDQGGAVYCNVGTGGTLTVSSSLFQGNTSKAGGAIYNDGCTTAISNSIFKTNQASSGPGGRGGAIHNAAPSTLTMSNSLLQGNSALDGGGLYNDLGAVSVLNFVTLKSNTGGYGGGLENAGTTTLNDSLVDANVVTGVGGGIWNLFGTVTLVRTRVTNNSAYEGGGINSYGTHIEITNASIMNNVTTGSNGGGVYISVGTAFITNATISDNHAVGATASGGGVYHSSDGNLTLTNVTLVNNQAGYFGGGLFHSSRYAVLTNVTIGNNTAGVAGNAIYEDSINSFVVQLKNSVIFGSTNNCDGSLFDSLGHNISTGTCSALDQPSDQNNFGGNLNLGSLTFNGGAFPMQTMLPLTGSPLINAGDNCSTTDQRGASRVGVCDIGAVEYGALGPIFADAPTDYWAWQYVERLYAAGITGGCSVTPLNYCPDSGVTRAQMAIFLLKGIHGSSYAPPAVGGSTGFGDVATDYWAAAWIKQLAAEGITGGCGGGNYCPDNTVTRAQMAVFLMKAKNGSSYSPPAVGGSTGFGDVATDYWAAAFIKQLVADGITSGCGNGNYCPESDVTRAQMAIFLVKTFNLP